MNTSKGVIAVIFAVVFAASMISAVAFSGIVAAAKSGLTKEQIQAKIDKKEAKITKLEKGGITAAEQLKINQLEAQIKKLQKQLDDAPVSLPGDTGDTTPSSDDHSVSQSNTAAQTSSCSTQNQTFTDSCNNTLTQSNSNGV